jgi:hypothetical protein
LESDPHPHPATHPCLEFPQNFSPAPATRSPAPGRTFPPTPGAGQWRHKVLISSASCELGVLPPPILSPRHHTARSCRPGTPHPPAPYPRPRGLPNSGGRCQAPRLGGRGPLPRVRTWPGLGPLHSARRLALTAPPRPAPRPPAGRPPGRSPRRPSARASAGSPFLRPLPLGALPALPSLPLRAAPTPQLSSLSHSAP